MVNNNTCRRIVPIQAGSVNPRLKRQARLAAILGSKVKLAAVEVVAPHYSLDTTGREIN